MDLGSKVFISVLIYLHSGLNRSKLLSFVSLESLLFLCLPSQSLSCVQLFRTHGLWPTRLFCLWNFPGKNPGVGCHFHLQGILPIGSASLVSPALAGRFFTTAPPRKPPLLFLVTANLLTKIEFCRRKRFLQEIVAVVAVPWTEARQGPLSFIVFQSLCKFMSIESVHLTISCSIVPFCSQSIGASASASVLPKNIQGWFPLGLTGLISLLSKGLSRDFSSITVQKHKFFGAQLFLWSKSHIHTWLMEEPYLWLYGSLLARWYLYFLIHCLGLS